MNTSKQIVFSNTNSIYETYSSEEYNRHNDNIPSFDIQYNATTQGGDWKKKSYDIMLEMFYFKRIEMKTAYENSLFNSK